MSLDLLKRIEVGVPLTALQHDANMTAIEAAVDANAAAAATKQDVTLAAGALGTGSVARTIASVLTDAPAVKSFGALGDNASDDTAAITALNASASSLRFTAGTYILDSFAPLAGTRLILERGAVLKLKSAAAGSLVRVTAANVEILGHGVLDGNVAGQSVVRDCIQILAGGNACVIRDVTLTGAKRAGINADGSVTPIAGLNISRVKISSCAQYGLFAEQVTDLFAEQLGAYDIGSGTLHHAITLKTCTRSRLVAPAVYRATGIGIELAGGSYNRVTDCFVKDASNIATSIAGLSTHNGFYGGVVDGTAVTAAYLTEISCVAGDNHGCYYTGMHLLGANNAGGGHTTDRAASWSHASTFTNQDCLFTNNFMRDCTRNFSASSGSRRALITNNKSVNPTSYHIEIGGSDGAVLNNACYGGTKIIALNATAGTFIDGNRSTSTTEDGIFEASASTLTQIGINYWGVTDKIDGIQGSLWLCTDGDVPTENITGYAQLYLESSVPKLRLPNGTILTFTTT